MKAKYIFWLIVFVLVTISIGYDYIKHTTIKSNHRFTVGFVMEYTEYVRTYNNRIDYKYTVDGKEYFSKFRSNELPKDLKGKRIVVKFSKSIRRWNVPLYNKVVSDSIQPPTEGWNKEPEFN